ncbi:phenylacetate--CoA ligase family protein [Natrialbaceae archaeon A-arb3/5]
MYANTSGGTTGEPVEFLQDDQYLYWNNANEMYYHQLAGRELGEPWIKLWGDESDLLDERQSLKDQLSDFVLNRHVLNSYRMGESEMREHIASINEIQPASIEAYVESIYELSKFILNNDLEVHSPNGILSTAGTLTEPMREVIEDAFDTTVLDKYGSREVGTVACECPEQEGLHVFSHTHYMEIVDEDGQPVEPGEEGKLVITALTNYTMPLIRYEIGDMAVKSETECSCGLPFSTIESVTGRVTDHFVTTDGELVYPGYLRKQLYHEPWVKKYQIRQTETDRVVYRVVLDGKPPQEAIDNVTAETQSLLGNETTVDFEYMDQIDPSGSGKFRYTRSDIVE